ncbi:MAG: hypothetical protein ACKVN9_01935 [Methylophilaceae bacterium]
MKLERVGANHNEGIKTILDVENISTEWCPKTKAIVVQIRNQSVPALKGQYNYTLKISPKDIASFLTTLSNAGIETSAPDVQKSLAVNSHELLRLLILSSGLALTPEPVDIRSKLQKVLAAQNSTPPTHPSSGTR